MTKWQATRSAILRVMADCPECLAYIHEALAAGVAGEVFATMQCLRAHYFEKHDTPIFPKRHTLH